MPGKCETTGTARVDGLFYHSTECEPTGVVTVECLFDILQNVKYRYSAVDDLF